MVIIYMYYVFEYGSFIFVYAYIWYNGKNASKSTIKDSINFIFKFRHHLNQHLATLDALM